MTGCIWGREGGDIKAILTMELKRKGDMQTLVER